MTLTAPVAPAWARKHSGGRAYPGDVEQGVVVEVWSFVVNWGGKDWPGWLWVRTNEGHRHERRYSYCVATSEWGGMGGLDPGEELTLPSGAHSAVRLFSVTDDVEQLDLFGAAT